MSLINNGLFAAFELVTDFSFLKEPGVLDNFLKGLWVTLSIAFFGVFIGIILGLLIGLAKLLAVKPLKIFASIYVTYFRATPLLVQLYLIYYLPSIIGIANVNAYLSSIIAIGLNSAAYVAEIFRGGVMSVDKGQFEAARSLGFNQNQTLTKVIIPQAFKNVLPSPGNEFIVIIKETAIVSVVSLKDIMYFAKEIGNQTYVYIPPLIFASLLYLVIVSGLTSLISNLERKLNND